MNNLPKRNMVDHIDEEDSINLKEIFNKLTDKWLFLP